MAALETKMTSDIIKVYATKQLEHQDKDLEADLVTD